MEARFRKRGVWYPPSDANLETKDAQYKLEEKWDKDAAFAAGDLVLSLDDTQQVHVDGIDGDTVAMWKALSAPHAQKKPGTRIALGDLLFAGKQPDETLQSFQSRVNGYRQRFHSLRDADYTLDKLEDELEIMGSLRGLPSEYEVLKQSLSLAASLTLADLRQAFPSKNTEEKESTPTAFYTAAAPAVPIQDRSSASSTRRRVTAPTSATPSSSCGRSTSICDTAATPHMTPHRGYFIEYRPYRTPIRVAQGALVFSEGVGTILFSNHDGTSLAMADVLHVPSLAFNLFAVFAFMQKAESTFEGSHRLYVQHCSMIGESLVPARSSTALAICY